MTDDEVNVYNALLARDGDKAATDYLTSIDDELRRRSGEKVYDSIKKSDPVTGTIGKTLTSFGAGMEGAMSGLGQLFKSDVDNPSNLQYTNQEIIMDSDKPGRIYYSAINSVGNMLPSILAGSATGNPLIGAAVMGVGARGTAYQQAIREGKTEDEANAYGLLIGVSEAALQNLLGGIGALGGKGISKLAGKMPFVQKIAGKIDNVFKNAISNPSLRNSIYTALKLGARMTDEGLEEYTQEILEPVFRNIVFNENNEFKLVSDEAIEAGIIGALTAGAFESPGVVANYSNTTRTGRDILFSDGALAQLLDQAQTFEPVTDAYQLAQRIAAAQQQGKNVRPHAVGEFTQSVIRQQIENARKSQQAEPVQQSEAKTEPAPAVATKQSDIVSSLIEKGVDETTASALAKVADGTYTDSDYASLRVNNPDVQAAYTDVTGRTLGTTKAEVRKAAKETPVNAQISASEAGAANYIPSPVIAAESSADKALDTPAVMNGEPVTVNTITSSKDGRVIVSLDNGGSANISDLTFSEPEIGEVYSSASIFGTNGAKAFVANYDGSIPLDSYEKGANAYYQAGKSGLSKDYVSKNLTELAATIPGEVSRESLYNAGKMDAAAKVETAKPKPERKKVPSGGVGVSHEYTGDLNDNQRAQIDALDAVGRALGITIRVKDQVAGGAANGVYVASRNEIEIALDAAIDKDGNYIKGAYMRVAGHELTHFIQQWSPEKYQVLRDFVVDELTRVDKAGFESRVQKVILDSGVKADLKLSRDEAIDEIVADSCEMFLKDSEAIQRLVKHDRSLAGKIADFIRDLVAKIQKAFDGISAKSPGAVYFEQNLELFKQAQQLWDDALVDAAEVSTAKENSGKNTAASVKFQSKKLGGYFPEINASTSDIDVFHIVNINNISEVKNKVYGYLKDKFISTEEISKPITNIDTGIEIEIRKGGISETFGNAKAYKDLSPANKKIKLATMTSLAKLIKYGEVRAREASNYHNPNSKASYAYLVAPITVDGVFWNVEMDIRKSERGNRFYIHKIKTAVGAPKWENDSRTKLNAPTANTNISQDNKGVNSSIRSETGNDSKFSLKDSDGRELTPEQAEFFKDSKVRDENGNLLAVYHGTNRDFTEFSTGWVNANYTSSFSDGFYFTEVKKSAEYYANANGGDKGKVISVYLNIIRPLVVDGIPAYRSVVEKGRYSDSRYERDKLRELKDSEILSRMGYDGVVYSDNGPLHEIVAFYPSQIKSVDNLKPTSDTDIRFQLKDVGNVDQNKLIQENGKLRGLIETLQQQLTIIEGHKVNPKSVEKMAGSLLRRFQSNYDKGQLVHNLTALFDWMANGVDVTGEEIMSVTTDICMKVLENSRSLNKELSEQYKPLRDRLRNAEIALSDTQKQEVALYYGSPEEFRRKNLGRIGLRNDGIPLDSLFPELAELYPEFLDADTHEADQPMALVSALDAIRPYYENQYANGRYDGMTMEQIASDMAADIYDEYFRIPEVVTFAMKKKREFDLMKAHYKNRIAEIRQDYKEAYEKKLLEVRKKNIQRIQQLAAKYESASAAEKAKYKEQMKKLRYEKAEQRIAQATKYDEKIKAQKEYMRDSAEVRKLKKSIQTKAKYLSERLLKPSDNKHIPQKLQRAIAEVCSLLNFETGRLTPDGKDTKVTEKLRSLQAKYAEIKDADSDLSALYD